MSAEFDRSREELNTPTSLGAAGGTLHDTATTLSILDRVLVNYGEGKRDFAIRLWDGTTVPADPGQESRFTLVLNRPSTLRRIMLPPNELALGEAFLDGDYDLEGDIIAAMRLGDVFEELSLGPFTQLSLAMRMLSLPREAPENGHLSLAGGNGRQPVRLRGAEHSRTRDKEAVTHHYDVGNDFYQLFLDRRMVYSCGYFPTGQEDLDDAQVAKLDHTCKKLRMQPGDRLLDIGCGWGALIIHAAERFGARAIGITLSQPQADLANQRIAEAGLSDRCQALVSDYRDLERLGPFDKVVSVGMVEHVGKARLRQYFEHAWKGLKPGGLFLNHGITAAARDVASYNPLDRFVFQKGAFVRKYVFPDAEVIPLGDNLVEAERAGFEVRDVESLREHYALTLRHWAKRLESNREEALKLVDERTYRTWRLYMAGCCHSFETARLNVHQSLLGKPDEMGNCPLPWSRADLYGGEG